MYMIELIAEQKYSFCETYTEARNKFFEEVFLYKNTIGKYTDEKDFYMEQNDKNPCTGERNFYENDECVIKLIHLMPGDVYFGKIHFLLRE